MSESLTPLAEVKIGIRAGVMPSSRVTRELWYASGTVTEVRTRPESAYRWAEPQQYFLAFDAPRKSVGALMVGVWLPKELLF